MKKLLCIILLFAVNSFGVDDGLKSIKKKTNAVLMGNVVNGQTDANAAYLENYVGEHFNTIIDFINSPYQRWVRAYDGLQDAVYDDSTFATSGLILGNPNQIDTVKNTTIYLTSGMQLQFPNNYKIDWKSGTYPDTCSYSLFKSYNDSNITITGGTYYGWSGTNTYSGNVKSATNGTVTIDGFTAIADSLQNWHIYITAGTGSGQQRKIVSNTATSGGNTACTILTDWSPNPDATSDYLASPLNQFEDCFYFEGSKNVRIQNTDIRDFAGDGLHIGNAENVYIDHARIITPNRWFYQSPYEWLVGRQAITIEPTNSPHSCPGWIVESKTALCKNIYITNSELFGGYYGIDIEPLSSGATVENVYIDNCTIGGSRAIGISGTTGIYKNIIISNCIFRDVSTYAVDLINLSRNSKNIIIDNCVFDSVYVGVLIGAVLSDVTISNCVFKNIRSMPILSSPKSGDSTYGTLNFKIFNNRFFNCEGGIHLVDSPYNLEIVGNSFINCDSASTYQSANVYISGAKNTSIRNNRFFIIDTVHCPVNYPVYLVGGDSIVLMGNEANGFNNKQNDPNIYSVTTYINSNNTWGITSDYGINILSNGSVKLDSAWYAMQGPHWQPLSVGLVNGEINSKPVANSDWGFMRFSAGGGTTLGTKTAIDLMAYSDTSRHANKIFLQTNGTLQTVVNSSGLALPTNKYINFDTTTYGSVGHGLRDSSGTVQYKNTGGTWAAIGTSTLDQVWKDSVAHAQIYINVKSFGAIGDSITDDTYSIQQAFDYAMGLKKNVCIIFPAACTFRIDSSIILSGNLSYKLTVLGYGSTILLGANNISAFAFNPIAGTKIYKNVSVIGINVNANKTGGNAYPAIGFMPMSGIEDANFDSLMIKDVTAYNLLADTSITIHKGGISITSNKTSTGAETYTKNIMIDNCHIMGGNYGFIINGSARTGGDNGLIYHYMDRISIVNCSYNSLNNDAVVYWASSGIQIGQYGYGDYVYIDNFKSNRCGDTGIEINNMRTVSINNSSIFDNLGTCIFLHNFSDRFTDYISQNIYINNCFAKYDGAGQYTTFVKTGLFSVDNPVGNIFINNSSLVVDSSNVDSRPMFFSNADSTTFKSVSINNCSAYYKDSHIGDFPAVYFSVIRVSCDSLPDSSKTNVCINNFNAEITGTGTANTVLYPFSVAGKNLKYDIKNINYMTAVNLVTDIDKHRVIALGRGDTFLSGSLNMSGSVDNIFMRKVANPVTYYLVGSNLSTNDKLLFTNIDSSGCANTKKIINIDNSNMVRNRIYIDSKEWHSTASANIMWLPYAHNCIVTGTTEIDSIPAYWAGYETNLYFSNGCDVDNSKNIKIPFKLAMEDSSVLHLVSDGTNWHSLGKSQGSSQFIIQGSSVSGVSSQTNISAFSSNGIRINGNPDNGIDSQDAITYRGAGTAGGAALAFGRNGGQGTFMSFYTNPTTGAGGGITERIRIEPSGHIGIHNNSPDTTLQITSGTSGASGLRFTNMTSASAVSQVANGKVLSVDADGDVVLMTDSLGFWKANGNDIYNTNSGRIGIGTNNPSYFVHVYEDDSTATFPVLIQRPTRVGDYLPMLKIGSGGNGNLNFWMKSDGTNDIAQWAKWDASDTRWENEATTTVGLSRMSFNPSGEINFYTAPYISRTENAATSWNNPLNLLGDGKVAINCANANNQLELDSGSEGASGFRFTRLKSTSTPVATNNKCLSVDANGDVVLANDATGSGDIEGVTAGTWLSGGGISGTVTVNVDTSKAASVYDVGLKLNTDGTTLMPSGWYMADGAVADIGTAIVEGEIRNKLSAASDYGFLRLSAGAGTTLNTLSAIDIVGYQTAKVANAIRFYTNGVEKARFNVNGLIMRAGAGIRFYETDTTHYVELKAGTLTGNKSFTLPITHGDAGQLAQTDGSGVMSWYTMPWTISGSDLYSATAITGFIGMHNSSPEAYTHIRGNGSNYPSLIVDRSYNGSGDWLTQMKIGSGNLGQRYSLNSDGSSAMHTWCAWDTTDNRWEDLATTSVGATLQEFTSGGDIIFYTSTYGSKTAGTAITWNNPLTLNDGGYASLANGLTIGTDADANRLDDATHGAGSTTLYIGNSTIDVTGPSDSTLKTNIVPTKYGLNDLRKLRVVDFSYKTDLRRKYTGLMAQQVKSILPKSVYMRSDSLLAVDYKSIIPVMIKSIQDLNDRIVVLEKDNKDLKKRIEKLEKKSN